MHSQGVLKFIKLIREMEARLCAAQHMKTRTQIEARIKQLRHKELFIKGLLNKDRARVAYEALEWVLKSKHPSTIPPILPSPNRNNFKLQASRHSPKAGTAAPRY